MNIAIVTSAYGYTIENISPWVNSLKQTKGKLEIRNTFKMCHLRPLLTLFCPFDAVDSW